MQYVFVLDAERRPMMPCRPARARRLLTQGRAAVFRRFPFTIILRSARLGPDAAVVTPLRLRLDPGSKTTGLAVVVEHGQASQNCSTSSTSNMGSTGNTGNTGSTRIHTTGAVVWAGEISHRGQQVKDRLDQRRRCRRSRRQRHTRYREPRFDNRRRREGWLAPSLESRVHNVLAWVARLRRFCPIDRLSFELVKFDTQLLQHPDITGIAYQWGERAGFEIRAYLLEKFHYRCVYCGRSGLGPRGVRLEIDHVVPRSRGGSDRVSNLVLSCRDCNSAKDNQTAEEFGHPEVQGLARAPLRDAAAVNSTRWALFRRLKALGLPVETGTGGRTAWNRSQRDLPKTHWVDAGCVGASTPARLRVRGVVPLTIKAMGRHSRQMCRTNAHGFPDKAPKATSVVGGFRTGDLVRAVVPSTSKKAGVYVGRIAVRATGSCNITTAAGTVQGIHHRYCRPLQRADGYTYTKGAALPPLPSGRGLRAER